MPFPDRPTRHRHWLWWGVPAGAALGVMLGWWLHAATAQEVDGAAPGAAASAPATGAAAAIVARAAPGAASAAVTGAPLTAAGLAARREQEALWRERLERAQQVLAAYRESTRYPHGSRPAAEQPDQMQPNDPVVEEHALKEPGRKTAAAGARLRTTQERVFAQGSEPTRISVAVVDAQGRTLPLRVLNAALREFTPPTVSSLYPTTPVTFNDEGRDGDAAAGDRVLTTTLRPAAQGFAGLNGQLRLEVWMEHQGERGFAYFDLYVTAEPPAVWVGSAPAMAREAVEDGSLAFYLKAQVRESGRYVVTGRVDDAQGRPFALLTFNDEVAAGAQEIRLLLFGKLIADGKPALPLALRDVEGFRLREEGHPDRLAMPRLPGAVLASAQRDVAAFSNAEWSSEERERYLAELTRDVDTARLKVEQLGGR